MSQVNPYFIDPFRPYIEHPLESCRQAQYEQLVKCELSLRRWEYLMFCVGNATYQYFQLVEANEITPADFEFWLEGLPENIASSIKKEGLEKNKNVLSFRRSILERRDLSMEDYIKSQIFAGDYEEYRKLMTDT